MSFEDFFDDSSDEEAQLAISCANDFIDSIQIDFESISIESIVVVDLEVDPDVVFVVAADGASENIYVVLVLGQADAVVVDVDGLGRDGRVEFFAFF
jgi:hypothetical protein